jgi:hypothetical protein
MQAALMFATPERGLVLQGHQALGGEGLRGLLGSAAPHLLLHRQQLVSPAGAAPFTSHVAREAMQGYAGLGVSGGGWHARASGCAHAVGVRLLVHAVAAQPDERCAALPRQPGCGACRCGGLKCMGAHGGASGRPLTLVWARPQDMDAATRSALLDFSYQVAAGSLEEAFRAVRGVRSRAVWRSMAQLAIRSKRLDIAGGWA